MEQEVLCGVATRDIGKGEVVFEGDVITHGTVQITLRPSEGISRTGGEILSERGLMPFIDAINAINEIENKVTEGEKPERGEGPMLFFGAVTERPLPKEAKQGKGERVVPLKGGVKLDLFAAPDAKTAAIMVARALAEGEEYNPERMEVHTFAPFGPRK